MARRKPAERLPSQTPLRHVLELGEALLCIAQDAAADECRAARTLLEQSELIINTTRRLIDGGASLWFADEVLKSFSNTSKDCLDEGSESVLSIEPTPLMKSCIENRRTCAAGRGKEAECTQSSDPMALQEARTISVPLLMHDRSGQLGRPLGALQVERKKKGFLQEEVELLEGLAVQATLSLQSSLRVASEDWRREQLRLVSEVSLQISSLRDLDDIARRVTDLILKTFDYYYVAVFTLEPGCSTLEFRASAGPAGLNEPVNEPVFAPVQLGEGIIGSVAESGNELLAPKVYEENRYRPIALLPDTCSEIALPLVVKDRLVGVLDVQSNQEDDFDEMDMLVLRALAGAIAIAIEDAQLYQDLRHRAVQLQTVYEVSSAITSILHQDELLQEVVRLIHERFGFQNVHLFTVHTGRRKIFFEAGSGLRSQNIRKEEYVYDLDDERGLIPWVARHAESALVNDVRSDLRYRPAGHIPDETLSEMTVPLVFGGNVLGVLDVQSDQTNDFGEEDRFLFEALADHIAIAMRNAYLYRTEVWRRGVADSLREVAGILSADVDLDQVLLAVLTELEPTLPLDAAAIWLIDQSSLERQSDERLMEGESYERSLDGQSEEAPHLHLAAVKGADSVGLDLEIGLQPDEVLKYNLDEPSAELLEQAATWLLEAVGSEVPLVRKASSPAEPLGMVMQLPMDYSAIAAPLKIGEQLLGVLCLVDRSAGRYGSEAQAMTAAFASYAAVAIQNARLYEDAHEQAWISTVLLQVANATQSIDNLPELLDTVIRITPMLTGVKACLLYILDEDGTFVPAAASGLNTDQQTEFERWRFAPGDVPALDRLVSELHPVILHQGEEDQRLSSVLTAGLLDDESDIGFPVLVPLIARNEILGAFLVDYSANLPTISLGKSIEAFFDERLAILQGIAHQTAVAVDNLRLLKSQKEEAYVSVALLQVAQAVVGSNDLDEALGSIVRITPILVGVKRAVIYLWDEGQNLFRTSQAYGLPRRAEKAVYANKIFPLLDAVLLEDALIAHPVESETEEDEAPETWTRLRAPNLEMVETFLEEEACLVLGFPLSMKGKVLGVFVVEEPDPVAGETYSSSNVNRRLRTKRIEIIRGISHQVALAIQNDMLQRETVERERLAREMQLAREIQQAFLPQQVPEIANWELQTHWRPAREVGGDIYDFFELPGKRMGLVIADVADKGMPAALFMTLVRTLVRATVAVLDSPAEVVRRVNDLIVPDASNGMFVTLVYAVLDLNTGELTAANAGHNPPLLLHRPCRFERVRRGGMALGVVENVEMEEFHSVIEPGEVLVLYTDGITEAFSPEGEIYGEERLMESIQQIAACAGADEPISQLSAQEILEAISASVDSFMGDAPLSDDLTMVVVKRNPIKPSEN